MIHFAESIFEFEINHRRRICMCTEAQQNKIRLKNISPKTTHFYSSLSNASLQSMSNTRHIHSHWLKIVTNQLVSMWNEKKSKFFFVYIETMHFRSLVLICLVDNELVKTTIGWMTRLWKILYRALVMKMEYFSVQTRRRVVMVYWNERRRQKRERKGGSVNNRKMLPIDFE